MNIKSIKPLSLCLSGIFSGVIFFMISFIMYDDFITSKIKKEKETLTKELNAIVKEKIKISKNFSSLTIPTKKERTQLQKIVAENKSASSISIIHNDQFVYSTFGIHDRKSTHIKKSGFYVKSKSDLTKKPIVYYLFKLNENTFIRIYFKPFKFDHLSLIGSVMVNFNGIEVNDRKIMITNHAHVSHKHFNLNDITLSVKINKRDAFSVFISKQQGHLLLLSILLFLLSYTLSKKIERKFIKNQIKNRRIKPYLQPIVNQNGSIIGAEILARWINNNGSIVPPYHFIPYIEKESLTPLLTRSLLEQIHQSDFCHLAKTFKLSFNLTEACLFDDHVFTLCQKLAKQYHLVLEFTESTPFVSKNTPTKMEEYRQLGVNFAIDDYGTGFSAPHYLTEYKFDYLKIDKCFVDNINNEPNSSFIIESIIFLARKLELELIAEGVEVQQQKQILDKLGIDSYQGFLFYKPMSLKDFRTLQGYAANSCSDTTD